MLKLTIPFTNEIVFNSASYSEHQHEEVLVNRFDETRAPLHLSVKTLLVQDIAVFMISINCPESVLIALEVTDYARMINFTLSGAMVINSTGPNGNVYDLTEHTYQGLAIGQHHHKELVIKGEAELFMVCLKEVAITNLVPVNEMALLPNYSSRFITPAMHQLIHFVITGSEKNTLHRVLLTAKVLELLFLDLDQQKKHQQQAVAPSIRLADQQKLEAARKLIGKNLQAPCSLIELAHKVGLNDFKLKKGFKDAFGTTVFGYLADLRMEKAKKMLAAAPFTISEVAHEVGYKNAHHFTAAFKKKFGYLPSKARNAPLAQLLK